jgi:hypothetical protein
VDARQEERIVGRRGDPFLDGARDLVSDLRRGATDARVNGTERVRKLANRSA